MTSIWFVSIKTSRIIIRATFAHSSSLSMMTIASDVSSLFRLLTLSASSDHQVRPSRLQVSFPVPALEWTLRLSGHRCSHHHHLLQRLICVTLPIAKSHVASAEVGAETSRSRTRGRRKVSSVSGSLLVVRVPVHHPGRTRSPRKSVLGGHQVHLAHLAQAPLGRRNVRVPF